MEAWAIGTSPHDLGLSEERFWDLTPCEFRALNNRQIAAIERAFVPFATLMAQQRNIAPFVKHDRTYLPEDYVDVITTTALLRGCMPGRRRKAATTKSKGNRMGPEIADAWIAAAEEQCRSLPSSSPDIRSSRKTRKKSSSD